MEWYEQSGNERPGTTVLQSYSQEKREDAMIKLRKATISLLISTMGVSGRGLNMEGVGCRGFWDMPTTLEQYKWCLGRVGRQASQCPSSYRYQLKVLFQNCTGELRLIIFARPLLTWTNEWNSP